MLQDPRRNVWIESMPESVWGETRAHRPNRVQRIGRPMSHVPTWAADERVAKAMGFKRATRNEEAEARKRDNRPENEKLYFVARNARSHR